MDDVDEKSAKKKGQEKGQKLEFERYKKDYL